jgi:hypothetical protein
MGNECEPTPNVSAFEFEAVEKLEMRDVGENSMCEVELHDAMK